MDYVKKNVRRSSGEGLHHIFVRIFSDFLQHLVTWIGVFIRSI